MDFFKKMENIKKYNKIRKQLFIMNNSYSDKELFYNEEKKKYLKFKVLNFYTQEMTVPLLFPIINLSEYLPKDFSKYFKQKYQGFDIIGRSLIDINYNHKKNNNNENNKIDFERLFYLKKKDRLYSCCLIRQGIHITGYIMLNQDSFEFISLKRILNDKENYYFDKEKNICYGAIKQYDKIYYYCYKDDSLEIFVRQNKSYYFEFNNLEDNNNNLNSIEIEQNDLKKNKKKLIDLNPTEIRNKFFDKITKKTHDEKDENFYSKNKYSLDYICESYLNKNISKFEYLMRINLLANRSYRDINQYPVFPWIIKTEIAQKEDIDYIKKKVQKIKNNNENNIILNNQIKEISNNENNENDEKSNKNNNENKVNNEISDNENNKIQNERASNPESSNSLSTLDISPLLNTALTQVDILLHPFNLRPLSRPMGTLTEYRFNSYELIYNLMREEFKKKYQISFTPLLIESDLINNYPLDEIPVYYSSHYSNPAYTCHYLTRLFPFSISALFIQGTSFDAPDRLFIDFNKSFLGASNTKCDLRELIPELYFQPEIFRNLNKLNLGKLQVLSNKDSTYQILKNKYNLKEDKLVRVEDVLLPNYCEDSPEKFICLFREMFERNEIKINEWIDIIFGYAQNGEEAYKKKNVFMPYCYQKYLKLEKINVDERIFYTKFFEFGVNPIQLFKKKLFEENFKNQNNNNNYDYCNIKFEKKEIDYDDNINENDLNDLKKYYEKKINEINDQLPNLEKEIKFEKKSDEEYIKKVKLKKEYEEFLYLINNTKFKMITTSKGKNKYMIFYNFYSGEIYIIKGNNYQLEIIRKKKMNHIISFYNLDNSEITSISINKYFLFGTRLGSIIIYKPSKYKFEEEITQKNLSQIIKNHTKKIICLEQNNILHLIISSSQDFYINIYLMPNAILVNSIYIHNFIADQIFLSFSPLTSLILFNKEKQCFKSFSINGRNLLNKDLIVNHNIIQIKIGKNNNFIQFLKCFFQNGFYIFKLPYLEQVIYNEN